ncbi:MAG: hypothetical protein ACYCWC_07340 [Rhodocyclaceae bacterium]
MDALPIRLPSIEQEAGLSFLYRNLNANGLALKEAQHWLSVRTWAPMTHSELPLWAWATSADRGWLCDSVVIANRGSGEVKYGFKGHKLGMGSVASYHSARICPKCIKQGRFHRLSWQLACVPGCAIHDQVLIDRCPYCERVISWNRPAMDVCTCGRFLTIEDSVHALPQSLSSWIRWIESRLVNQDGFVNPRDFGLPDLFGSLSIDGSTRVTVAAGLLPDGNASPGIPSKLSRTSLGMAKIISRGLNRLAVLAHDFSNLPELRPIFHVPAIERMRAQEISQADETVAEILLGILGYLPYGAIPGHGSSRRRQKVLF